MMASGLFMKYPIIPRWLPGLDPGLVRYLHNQMSFFFSLTLTLMMLTGLYMFFFPWLKKKFSKNYPPTPPASG